MGDKPKKLNSRQKKFVDNHLQGMSNAEAYREAGYKPKDVFSASSAAGLLLKNIEVQEAIKNGREKIREQMDRYVVANALRGFAKQAQLIDFSTPTVMWAASKSAIETAGYKPNSNVNVTGDMTFNLAQAIIDGEV